ncbi:MAG: class I SAM-dependent methyltransferase [Planctomycetales bacterium]|nr:class I SAM-dependent methyltransferase [Planctomycetales bacterium]
MYQFGEAYAAGSLTFSGDLAAFLEYVYRHNQGASRKSNSLLCKLLHRYVGNARRRSRSSIHFHYDLGNEFFARWLDHHMLYSCAYFERPDWVLEEAQRGPATSPFRFDGYRCFRRSYRHYRLQNRRGDDNAGFDPRASRRIPA